jgi:hypothetical protein
MGEICTYDTLERATREAEVLRFRRSPEVASCGLFLRYSVMILMGAIDIAMLCFLAFLLTMSCFVPAAL